MTGKAIIYGNFLMFIPAFLVMNVLVMFVFIIVVVTDKIVTTFYRKSRLFGKTDANRISNDLEFAGIVSLANVLKRVFANIPAANNTEALDLLLTSGKELSEAFI